MTSFNFPSGLRRLYRVVAAIVDVTRGGLCMQRATERVGGSDPHALQSQSRHDGGGLSTDRSRAAPLPAARPQLDSFPLSQGLRKRK